MRFLHPWLLLAIPPVIVAGLAASMILTRRARRLALLANAEVLRRAGFARAGAAGFAERLRTCLLTGGLVILSLAAARPQWGRSDFKVASRGASLLIALDVSRSMLAADVHPNRLERAKADILDLIGDLRGDRAGLLAFRGRGVMLCPLTADYAFLRQAIDGVSVDSAPRGETDIADAIEKCLEALATSAEDNCAIVLISDGEDLAGRAAKAAAKAAARNIPIFTVGIGDLLTLICAFGFALHIICIDRCLEKGANGLQMACIQFFTAGLIMLVCMFIFEHPQIDKILEAKYTILYTGIMSSGVAYTLQIIGQRYAEPTIATLLMSLESVFAVLSGWLIL
ncbi:MAG: VWA domain-containing protein, partial [Kiritimatiellae bacterium]|nr:VWA domain-containing protein [Kiritimatiellia bacterium]